MDQTSVASDLTLAKPIVVAASSSLIKPSLVGFTQQRHSGSLITLKINIVDLQLTKTLQFWPQTQVFDALGMLREKVPEIQSDEKFRNHGFFVPNSDPCKSFWLEASRTLEHYHLMSGDMLQFASKLRRLHLRLLDGEKRTLLVDDSQSVGQLMLVVCGQMGIIANHEEYSLIHDLPEEEKERTLTLRRQTEKSLSRDQKKMEELKKKLHTEDDIAWLDHGRTLRQQGIDEAASLVLKRKFFFSDKNIDTRDPVQLNLLYVQCRDAILNGTHPINENEAVKFAAIQYQVNFGDHVELTHKNGCLDKCAKCLCKCSRSADIKLNSGQLRAHGLGLKEYLPKEYVKVKGIEKKIIQEYKSNLSGLSELDAKHRYTQLCRSLKTYGVTFFLVKEKMKGKNKLVARLLGVTKESLLRVDEKTKEFLNVYPLECVKKWAASPNTFTLDFGDHYKEPYYSMQTTEGEHIARLISGYIDIILKKKKAKEYENDDHEHTQMLTEDTVTPNKATLVQIKKNERQTPLTDSVILPGIMRSAQVEGSVVVNSGGNNSQMANISRQAYPGLVGDILNNEYFMQHQKPLMVTIKSTESVISNALLALGQRPVLQELGSDPASRQWRANTLDVQRSNITSRLSAINAATAQILNLTSNGLQNTEQNAVCAALATISVNLGDMARDVLTINGLQPDEGEKLTEASKRLCKAFTEFLNYIEPEYTEPRQSIFGAVGRISEAGHEVLRNLEHIDQKTLKNCEDEPRLQDTFVSLAKTVASCTASLVIASKSVANHCTSQVGVNEVISMVTQCALNTSQLVACTKVCACTVNSRQCQEQIVEAARQVQRQVDAVGEVAVEHCRNATALTELKNSACSVSEAVKALLRAVKGSQEQINNQLMDSLFGQINDAIEKIFGAVGNPQEIICQARLLAAATTELVNSLKRDAHCQANVEQQRKLLLAAKLLAEATSRMVEAAKGCATNPSDLIFQEDLQRAAEDLRRATQVAAGDEVQLRMAKKLELSAKQAASCATQAIAAIQVCTQQQSTTEKEKLIGSTAMHSQLIQQCKQVADNVPKIVQGIRGCMVSPLASNAHLGLTSSCEAFVPLAQKMVLLTKAILPTIGDEIKAIQLRNCTNQLGAALADLKACLAQTRHENSHIAFKCDDMIAALMQLNQELIDLSCIPNLKPLPGENLKVCEAQLAASSKTVGLSMAQMLTAAAQGNELFTGVAAKETMNSLCSFANSVRAVVACSENNTAYQQRLIASARLVIQQSESLVVESAAALLQPDTPQQNQQRLAAIARSIAQSLYNCVNCLPGQDEIDTIIQRLNEVARDFFEAQSHQLRNDNQSTSDHEVSSRQQAHSDLSNAALALNASISRILVDSRRGSSQKQLSNSVQEFRDRFVDFFQCARAVAEENSLREVHSSSVKLLQGVKVCLANPQALLNRQQLAIAAKHLTESLNASVCSIEGRDPVAEAQKECDNALRDIQTIRTIVSANSSITEDENELAIIMEPPPTTTTLLSYYDCLDQIIEKSRTLGESMTGIANSCKTPVNPEAFMNAVNVTSTSVCGLVETAAYSAYLIGVSDVESKRGTPQIVDASHFIEISYQIQDTCNGIQTLLPPTNLEAQQRHQKLIASATKIAQLTANLCSASQQASANTSNILAKRHFVQSAKQVANATASLVKAIKAPEQKQQYDPLIRALLESVQALCEYALSTEFAAVPAIISDEGARLQLPILEASRVMLSASEHLISTSRSLIASTNDPLLWQAFSSNSKLISDAIKRLATAIKEQAPAKKECEQALSSIKKCMQHLESAIRAITMNQVLPLSELANSKSLQAYQEHAVACAGQMAELVDQLRVAAKGHPEQLGQLITQIGQYFEPLVVNVIGCAAKTPFNHNLQQSYLGQTKTILESVTGLLGDAKQTAGNPKQSSEALDEFADGTKEALYDLVQTLENATAQSGNTHSMIDSLTKTIAQVDLTDQNCLDEYATKETISLVDLQTRIVTLTKKMQETVKDMTLCDTAELGSHAQQLTQQLSNFILVSKSFVNRSGVNSELASKIEANTQELVKSTMTLVHTAGQLQNTSSDRTLRSELNEQAETVAARLLAVLHSFHMSARGTQTCIHADASVSGIVADLNTVIMFATAGTLKSDIDQDSFGNHREAILRTAKTLVEDTKALVSTSGCGQVNQDQLATGVQTSVRTMTRLSEVVKLGAASLGSEQPDAQVLLINTAKDVAASLSDLIGAIKIVASNQVDENVTGPLRESAKNMVTNVQSLLKTVKTVEDEAARGTRALESAIEAIFQEIRSYSSYVTETFSSVELAREDEQQLHENIASKSEDLIRATKQITLATSKAIGAANSLLQEDVITAANMGRKAVSDLLYVCRGSFGQDRFNPNNAYQQRVLSVGLNCALNYKELLEGIQSILLETTETSQQQLLVQSKSISGAVTDLLQIAEILKAADDQDRLDSTLLAENELLGASDSIDAATKKLQALQPRSKVCKRNSSENLNFDEQILEAAKSITNAAGVLIKAATAAQKELVAQGKASNSNCCDEDGQWSEGLISAARMVAATCHALCEAANGLVQGHATEERLISSAKQVASSTAALLVACKVKAEITSQAMKRLQHAGNAIKRATDALVRAAQQAVDLKEDDHYLELNTKFVGSIAQEIMLREEILRKERELKAAQAAYSAVKKARYHRDDTSPNSSASTSQQSTDFSNQSSQSSSSHVSEPSRK